MDVDNVDVDMDEDVDMDDNNDVAGNFVDGLNFMERNPEQFRDALDILLMSMPDSIKLCSVLMRVKDELSYFDVVEDAQLIVQEIEHFASRDNRIQINRYHNHASSVIRDLFEILNDGNRGHCTYPRYKTTITVLHSLCTVARSFQDKPSVYLHQHLRDMYDAIHHNLINPFVSEDFRRTGYANTGTIPPPLVCSNAFIAEMILLPKCRDCMFCNKKMQNAKDPIPSILMVSDGFKYIRQHRYVCENKDCLYIGASRSYGAIQYKRREVNEENGNLERNENILVHQWERVGYYLDISEEAEAELPGGVLPHRTQDKYTRGELKAIQVGDRFFIDKSYVQTYGTDMVVHTSSFFRLAQAFALNLTQKIDQGIVDSIDEATFTELVQNAYKEPRIRRYLEDGFKLYCLEGRCFSTRIGEPLFIQNIESAEIEARCPLIPGIFTDVDGNYQFVDDQALFPDFNNPTRAWKREFKGIFTMGAEGNALSHSFQTTFKVNFGLSVTANIRFHNSCMKDVPREDGNHECLDCVKVNVDSGNWVQGMNMDGVWQPVHVCKHGDTEEGACRSLNINARKRYCDDEHIDDNDICGVENCDRHIVQGTLACDEPLHSQAYVRWKNAKDSMREKLRTYMCEEAKRGAPRVNPTLRTVPGITAELEQLLRLRAEELNDPELTDEGLKDIINEIFDACDEGILREITGDINHSFGRAYSFGELFSLHSCGHGVGRTHCYRTEALHTALMHVLIMTDGGRRRCPTHLFYDRACSLLYYLQNIALPEFADTPRENWPELEHNKYTTRGEFQKTFVYDDMARLFFKIRMIVDPFHYSKHSHNDVFVVFCNRFCTPNIDVENEQDPVRRDLVIVGEDDRPVRILNGERQETRAGEDGPFSRMTRNQKFDKAMFTMDTIQLIKNEIHFYKQLRRGMNPRYLVPSHQGPDKWYDLVDDQFNDDNITVEILHAHVNPPVV